MKKILALVVGLMLAASVSFADTSKSSSSTGYWIIQAQGGIGLPISSEAATVLDLGFNGELQVGYGFSNDFSLSVESGIDTLSLNTNTIQKNNGISGATFTSVPALTHIPLQLVAQLNLTGGSVTPYFLLGAGVAFDSFGGTLTGSANGTSFSKPYTSNTSWTNFDLEPGFGVAFSIANQTNIFVQTKLSMDFGPTTGVNAESSDSPMMSLPIQLGVNFGL